MVRNLRVSVIFGVKGRYEYPGLRERECIKSGVRREETVLISGVKVEGQ